MIKNSDIFRRSFLIMLLSFFILGLGYAQEDDLDAFFSKLDKGYLAEEVGVKYEETSAGHKIKVTKSPASVSVISSKEIENSWATNIPDLLRNTLGVDVIGIAAGTHMVSIRGSNPFSSQKVGLLIDGQMLEPLIYGTNTYSQIPVSIGDLKSLKVLHDCSRN